MFISYPHNFRSHEVIKCAQPQVRPGAWKGGHGDVGQAGSTALGDKLTGGFVQSCSQALGNTEGFPAEVWGRKSGLKSSLMWQPRFRSVLNSVGGRGLPAYAWMAMQSTAEEVLAVYSPETAGIMQAD